MTEPITKKDDSVKEHSEAKASKKISTLQKSDKLQDQLDKQDKQADKMSTDDDDEEEEGESVA